MYRKHQKKTISSKIPTTTTPITMLNNPLIYSTTNLQGIYRQTLPFWIKIFTVLLF
jgi:hypothetical protein